MIIIGLTGKAGVGKDTIADYLVAKYSYKKRSFAEPLKAALCAMFNWDIAQFDDRAWKEAVLPESGKSPRQLMQSLGTEWGRSLVHDELWLRLMQEKLDALLRWEAVAHVYNDVGVVVSDIRFENESALIRSMGGEIWHVVRDVPNVQEHASEAGVALQAGDVIIANNGSIEQLRCDLDELL